MIQREVEDWTFHLVLDVTQILIETDAYLQRCTCSSVAGPREIICRTEELRMELGASCSGAFAANTVRLGTIATEIDTTEWPAECLVVPGVFEFVTGMVEVVEVVFAACAGIVELIEFGDQMVVDTESKFPVMSVQTIALKEVVVCNFGDIFVAVEEIVSQYDLQMDILGVES